MSATRDEVVDYLATATDGEVAQLMNDARNAATARNGDKPKPARTVAEVMERRRKARA